MTMPMSTTCPHCGRPNDAVTATSTEALMPSDGAITLCWGCLRWSVFQAGPLGLILRAPTLEEHAEIDADEHAQQSRRAMLAAKVDGIGPMTASRRLREG